jgi:hypothetical protein
MKLTILSILLLLCFGLTSCDLSSTVDEKETSQQEKMLKEGSRESGMPAINNFSERKILKALYELRDAQHVTYTYTQSLDGKFHFLCNSIGYPMPYSAQLTNPSKIGYSPGGTPVVLPQAEPNGIFAPPSSDATWVMCSSKKDLVPVYVEQKVIASPQKLSLTGEIDDKSTPTFTISGKK